MHSKTEEAVITLATLKSRADLAVSKMRIHCKCTDPDERRESCPWYRDWRKLADEADEYERRVYEVFPLSEARAIEIRATALGFDPGFHGLTE